MTVSQDKPQALFLNYQIQYKLISKVLEELSVLENSPLFEVFDDHQAIENIISIYQDLKSKIVQKMQHEIQSNKAILDSLNKQTAKTLLHAFQNDMVK